MGYNWKFGYYIQDSNHCMLKQNCSMEQSVDSDEEFENVENVILAVFRLLKEYDRLVEIAETEMKKIGGETYG